MSAHRAFGAGSYLSTISREILTGTIAYATPAVVAEPDQDYIWGDVFGDCPDRAAFALGI
jgi:hypothetical protein